MDQYTGVVIRIASRDIGQGSQNDFNVYNHYGIILNRVCLNGLMQYRIIVFERGNSRDTFEISDRYAVIHEPTYVIRSKCVFTQYPTEEDSSNTFKTGDIIRTHRKTKASDQDFQFAISARGGVIITARKDRREGEAYIVLIYEHGETSETFRGLNAIRKFPLKALFGGEPDPPAA
jgi:hypothetical protein